MPFLPPNQQRQSTEGKWYTDTHTHLFNGPFSGTTQVSQYQKGGTNLDFTEARDSEWQWHQLGQMQVCTLLQTGNHASTPPLSFYRPVAVPAAQPTASKHWRHKADISQLNLLYCTEWNISTKTNQATRQGWKISQYFRRKISDIYFCDKIYHKWHNYALK